MKYIKTKNTKKINGVSVFQIQRISDKKLGGWIEEDENLSQQGDAFVYDDAVIFGNAQVFGNAKILGNAQIYENAVVFGNAEISGNAQIKGNAQISKNAQVFNYAQVFGNALIYGNAWIFEHALIYGFSEIYENAQIFGHAEICGHAKICGDVPINRNIKISKDIFIQYRINCNQLNLRNIIKGSLNIYPNENKKYILYKKVHKIGVRYFSLYDPNFEYKIGKIAEVESPELSDASCSSGLHLSHPDFFKEGDALLQCEVALEDIITCQEGKIRCKKCRVIQEII